MLDLLIQFDEHPDGQKIVRRTYKDDVPAYRALKNHNCENLPKVYYAEMCNGVFIVEEEFIDGVSLQEILDGGGRMTMEKASKIGMDICEALQFLHTKGYIHRDIKPEHIIMTPEGRTVLIDLDATMQIRPDRNTDTQLMGTAIYAAPEQFGLVRSDQRTDIYGMGILLNEMITGVHPVVERCREGKIGDIIERCIRINLDERYPSVSALRDDLNEALGNPSAPQNPTTSQNPTTPSVSSPSKSPATNKKAKIAAMVLAAAILLGIGAWASSSLGGQPAENPDNQVDDEPGIYQEDEEPDGDLDEDLDKDKDKDDASDEEDKDADDDADADKDKDKDSKSEDTSKKDDTSKKNNSSSSSTKPTSSTSSSNSTSNTNSNSNSTSNSTSTAPKEEGQLYIGRDTVIYNSRLGAQSPDLRTEDGTLIDDTYKVTADSQIGRIAGWDSKYNGWTIDSQSSEMGATGYIHASKDGKSYKIKVVVMGEPMSAYNCIPTFSNIKNGYLKPGGKAIGQQRPNQIFVDYNPSKKTTLYLAAQVNFWNVVPSCTDEHVRITKYEGAPDWQYPLYKMTFENKEGGNVQTTVTSSINTLAIYFRDETL